MTLAFVAQTLSFILTNTYVLARKKSQKVKLITIVVLPILKGYRARDVLVNLVEGIFHTLIINLQYCLVSKQIFLNFINYLSSDK